MKTTMKQLAAGTIIALLLLVGNVNAKGTETTASRHENIESTLQLEKWMTNETIWNSNSAKVTAFTQETESNLELESWMTSTETWNRNYSFIQETESGMELENWMTANKSWNVKLEAELTVENWMMNNTNWN